MVARPVCHHLATQGWLRLLFLAALVLATSLVLEISPAEGASRAACRVRNTHSGETYRTL